MILASVMDNTPSRRSGRQRVPNKKYSSNTIALEALNQALESDTDDDAHGQALEVDPQDDEDFPADQATQISDSPDSLDSDASAKSDGSAIATPAEEHQEGRLHGSVKSDGPQLAKRVDRKPKARDQYGPRDAATRSRGIVDNSLKTDKKGNRLDLLSGPDRKDTAHIIRSRAQWGNDPTLPKRSHMRHPYSHTEGKRVMEATVGWDWYYEQGGLEDFSRTQQVHCLSVDESAKYLPMSLQAKHDFLMGPYGRQKLFSLSKLQSLNIDDAWNAAASEQNSDSPDGPRKRRRHGWMLNVGTRVRHLDWAANHEGDTQYLAIATKRAIPKQPSKYAPSFTPAPPAPSSVQIWAFAASPTTRVTESSMDLSRSPTLSLVLCTDWGDAKTLKWCPMPRTFKEQGIHGKKSLGLLASIWDDGCARVLDVHLDEDHSGSTSHCTLLCYLEIIETYGTKTSLPMIVKVESAAFTAHPPPNSICSCLAWLSATDLAIGHSNGYLSIYSIAPSSNPPASILASASRDHQSFSSTSPTPLPDQSQPRNPWVHFRLHQTYITALAPAYPSFPTLLASASMSGHTRLTSLVAPQTSYVQSRRSHTPAATMIYYDALYGCIFPDEGRETLAFTALRLWGSSIGFGEAEGSGTMACIDAGKVHTAVALGAADGKVVVLNPVRKVLNRREQGHQQTVFRHEWVPKRTQTAPQTDVQALASDNGDSAVVVEERLEEASRMGISRITEGYKPQKAEPDRRTNSSLIQAVGRGGRGSATTTIFEEEAGATAVCWNPNLSCGSWLAAGWGSGLVRVEDVGI